MTYPIGRTALFEQNEKSRCRIPSADRRLYAFGARIECFINRLKNCRRVATRYDRTATSFPRLRPARMRWTLRLHLVGFLAGRPGRGHPAAGGRCLASGRRAAHPDHCRARPEVVLGGEVVRIAGRQHSPRCAR